MRHVQRSESYVSGLECTLSGVFVRSIGYTYSHLLWDRDRSRMWDLGYFLWSPRQLGASA